MSNIPSTDVPREPRVRMHDDPFFRLNIASVGVRPEDYDSLALTIKAMGAIDNQSVTTDEGWLQCEIIVKNLTRDRRREHIKKTIRQITNAVQHRADNPGRGVTRRRQAVK